MTRLPSRYRPVTVATLHNGKLVIGEVMNIPPEQRAPQPGVSTRVHLPPGDGPVP